MSVQRQQALDSLYAIDNVLTVTITMPDSDWAAVRTEQPAGGICNFDWKDGARYTWRKAATVEISGTHFPARTTFADVGVKKKSFCGSIDSDKPCLHVDLGKFSDANIPAAEALIGSRYLTLNNSKQDPSYIRQPLGYTLLGMAGLPHSRCNFARVVVNGKPVGTNAPGVFVNAEPIMKRYIERNFNGNTDGNLYELEHTDDLVKARLPFIGVESLSRFEDKADLTLAVERIAADGLAGVDKMLDLDQFIQLYAMEFLLKHWDGYADNTNNTYLYNDLKAVASPGPQDVRFKMIPWGIDQTLKPQIPFKMGREGLVARLVREDADRHAQLIDQIRTYRDTVVAREIQQTTLKAMIDRMEALLTGLGVPNAPAEIATVRKHLRLAESAALLCAGVPGGRPVHVLKRDTSECLHASNTEGVPADVTPPVNFEVYGRPLPDADDPTDLWTLADLGTGKSVTSRAFGRALHASDTLVTEQGHKFLYTCPSNNGGHADEFSIAPVDTPDAFTWSGYCRLTSVRTGLGVTSGTDTTPTGRSRFYQDTDGADLYFY